MNKEFIPYQESLALKELGFDEPCFGYHTNDKDYPFILDVRNLKDKYKEETTAPTFSQAFRWFREKYKLHQIVLADQKGKYDIIVGERISGSCLGQYETYEEAELACLIKLIEIANKIKYSSSDVPTYYN